jgi:hypothetical protein
MQTIFLESSGADFFNNSSRAPGRIMEFPPNNYRQHSGSRRHERRADGRGGGEEGRD